jgi:hypothetical protein
MKWGSGSYDRCVYVSLKIPQVGAMLYKDPQSGRGRGDTEMKRKSRTGNTENPASPRSYVRQNSKAHVCMYVCKCRAGAVTVCWKRR